MQKRMEPRRTLLGASVDATEAPYRTQKLREPGSLQREVRRLWLLRKRRFFVRLLRCERSPTLPTDWQACGGYGKPSRQVTDHVAKLSLLT